MTQIINCKQLGIALHYKKQYEPKKINEAATIMSHYLHTYSYPVCRVQDVIFFVSPTFQ